MADLYKKFSEAVKMISFAEKSIQECVYCAFVDHLSDINTDDLPWEIQIFYALNSFHSLAIARTVFGLAPAPNSN